MNRQGSVLLGTIIFGLKTLCKGTSCVMLAYSRKGCVLLDTILLVLVARFIWLNEMTWVHVKCKTPGDCICKHHLPMVLVEMYRQSDFWLARPNFHHWVHTFSHNASLNHWAVYIPEIHSVFLLRIVGTDATFVLQTVNHLVVVFALVRPDCIEEFPPPLGRDVFKLHVIKNSGFMKTNDFVGLDVWGINTSWSKAVTIMHLRQGAGVLFVPAASARGM